MIQMLFYSLPAHGEELSNRIDFYKDKNVLSDKDLPEVD